MKQIIVSLVFALALQGCSTVESAGEGVEGIGQATGSALSSVGRGAGEVIAETGEAVDDAAERTRRRGY